ncbi:MAG TPA: nuclear transport factor 2 family protein [Bacteroidota bacterium]
MKVIHASILLLSVEAMLLGCAPKPPNPDEMIAAAKDLDQKFVEAYNKGDVDAVMATYWNSPDLVSYPPDAMQAKGWEAAKEGITHALSAMPGFKLELTAPEYIVAGDMVISYGTWKGTVTPPAGEPMTFEGRYSDVKAKKDGKWVYIMDHASVPLPPPPAK